MSVFQHGTSLLAPERHASKLIVVILTEICQYIPILIKIKKNIRSSVYDCTVEDVE